jgi:hypothetical protein
MATSQAMSSTRNPGAADNSIKGVDGNLLTGQ